MPSIVDNDLDYPSPNMIVSDNKNICQTWQIALQDSEFKSMYDDFSYEAKEKINDNLSSRTCLNIDSDTVSKCYTTNKRFETCGNLAKELPNSLKSEMNDINTQITTLKKEMMDGRSTLE